MRIFEYSIFKIKAKITISDSEIDFQYGLRNRKVPIHQIRGIALGYVYGNSSAHVGRHVGGALGGLIGHAINKKFGNGQILPREVTKEFDLQNLPQSSQLQIAYEKEPGSNINKLESIPLNPRDPQCQEMIKYMLEKFDHQYVGVGPSTLTLSALNISQKKAMIIILIVLLLIIGGIVAASSSINFGPTSIRP